MRTWFEKRSPDSLLASSDWLECEDRIQAFENSWRNGQSPRIADYLHANGPIRRALLIELVCVDLEFRLKAGEVARVRGYMDDFPELTGDRNAALELLATEYELRRRHRNDVSLDEYRVHFPEYLDELSERLNLSEMDTWLGTPGTIAPAPWPEVPGYEIVGEIGRGGMGIVYKAIESSLRRPVALKFLPVEFAQDADRLERFLREARTASALNHPYICIVHALGRHEDRPFIVMEFIEGETLQAQVARRPSLEQVARWIGQAAQALATAHAAGVVHRDIKPENMMVRPDGYVKVLDFGLARRLPTLAEPKPPGSSTDHGGFFGTVGYMSPEQAYGRPVDSATDIFSLGIVLFQLATGQHPFLADSALATLNAIAMASPAPASRLNPDIPAALAALNEAMLQKDPRLRPTAAEVDRALSALVVSGAPSELPAAWTWPIVHREPELAILESSLRWAEQGAGGFVCVAGEPGIGKTTLIEDFLASPAVTSRNCLIVRGHCSERLGATEAYLPIIDALHDFLRSHAQDAVGRLLKVAGPTWHTQIVAPAPSENLPGPFDATRAASQPALLREFRSVLAEISRLAPVVVFLDDVHWVDASTVDLLAHLARHIQSMRVLVIVTYRPTELLLGPHPFHGLKLELQTRGVCQEIAVSFLARDDIDRYLKLAFPGHAFADDFAEFIHARTEGNALFVVDLLRYLKERKVVAEVQGRWRLAHDLPDVLRDLPGSVRSMIQRKLERLSEGDRRLLSAASVQGTEFDSLVVARALELDSADVEERLAELDRIHGLVRTLREHEFPDRTLTLRYQFVHVLYQQALYNDLPPTRRASLACSVARELERHHGADHPEAAGELACLYEVGRDFERAARQFWLAALNDARVFAHREAVVLARRGLELLAGLPATEEKALLELSLQTTLGLQLQVTEGFAAPDAGKAYSRARELCRFLPGASRLFPVLWAFGSFRKCAPTCRVPSRWPTNSWPWPSNRRSPSSHCRHIRPWA